jgi:hemerythrin
MNLPQLPLGVAVMDEDHYALEQMFARTPQIEDADLPAHLDAIIEAIRAHFAREEAEMERVRVPTCNAIRASTPPCSRRRTFCAKAFSARTRE